MKPYVKKSFGSLKVFNDIYCRFSYVPCEHIKMLVRSRPSRKKKKRRRVLKWMTTANFAQQRNYSFSLSYLVQNKEKQSGLHFTPSWLQNENPASTLIIYFHSYLFLMIRHCLKHCHTKIIMVNVKHWKRTYNKSDNRYFKANVLQYVYWCLVVNWTHLCTN